MILAKKAILCIVTLSYSCFAHLHMLGLSPAQNMVKILDIAESNNGECNSAKDAEKCFCVFSNAVELGRAIEDLNSALAVEEIKLEEKRVEFNTTTLIDLSNKKNLLSHIILKDAIGVKKIFTYYICTSFAYKSFIDSITNYKKRLDNTSTNGDQDKQSKANISMLLDKFSYLINQSIQSSIKALLTTSLSALDEVKKQEGIKALDFLAGLVELDSVKPSQLNSIECMSKAESFKVNGETNKINIDSWIMDIKNTEIDLFIKNNPLKYPQ